MRSDSGMCRLLSLLCRRSSWTKSWGFGSMLCSALREQLMLDYHCAQGSVPRGSCRELAARRLKGDWDLAWVVGSELTGWQCSSSGSVITESLKLRMCCRNPALRPFRTWGEVELLRFWQLPSSSSSTACAVCVIRAVELVEPAQCGGLCCSLLKGKCFFL